METKDFNIKRRVGYINKNKIIAITILAVIIIFTGGCGNQTEDSSSITTNKEKTESSYTSKKASDDLADDAADDISDDIADDNTDDTSSVTDINADSSSSITLGQKNALRKAQDYLDIMAFSYEGLIGQLEFEGFSNDEAVYAVDNCGADWNEQAAKKAQDYLDIMSFSKDGLISQLEFEKFTREQAIYGANAVGYEETSTSSSTTNTSDDTSSVTLGQKNALEKAQDYLDIMAFSYEGLIGQLEFEGFSKEEAVYAVDNCGADWYEQAAKKAQDYLDLMSFSREGLINQLEFENFTLEQAIYGAEAVGY